MAQVKQAVVDFLAQSCIAVVGVSRNTKEAANLIYRKLKDSGKRVFAINPNAESIEGERCYPNLHSIQDKIDAVVIVTKPEVTEQVVKECAELKIPRVWMHRSFGNSVSDAAVAFCRRNGIKVIPGGCPMMFCEPVDFAHKCLRWTFRITGRLPSKI